MPPYHPSVGQCSKASRHWASKLAANIKDSCRPCCSPSSSRVPAPADPGGFNAKARAPLGPEKPARSKATACGARSPSFSNQFVAVNPAPVLADRARPSSPISPTSRPSLLISKTGRSASAQSPSPATKGSTAQACARPRISTAQTPAAAISGTAVTTPAIYALGTVTTVVSFAVMGITVGLALWLKKK